MTPTPPISARGKSRRRLRVPVQIPPALESEIRRFAQKLSEGYGAAFARDRQLKHRLTAKLQSLLPPQPRRPGRPGSASVTAAIRLRQEIKRQHPERPDKEIWREVYPETIPNYHGLRPPERRDAQDRLRQQVRWRLSARRRRQRGRKPALRKNSEKWPTDGDLSIAL